MSCLSHRSRILAVTFALALLAACVVVREVQVTELPRTSGTVVATPVKAHLHDGRIVVFDEGAVVTADSMLAPPGGAVTMFSPTLEVLDYVGGVALADVLGAEVYREATDDGKTFLYSLGATALTKGLLTMIIAGGDVGPIKAIFGSCPTIYSDSAGFAVLEAESFSSSIAPLLARRDVDALRAQPDANGRLRLEVRNEAFETHYIDQLEIVEVVHEPDERAFAAPFGYPVAVRSVVAPASARDRNGRDVRADLRAADGRVFASSDVALANATNDDAGDWIDVTLPTPDADSVALLMRVRSSLLTTHLFYEHMLTRPGAHAFDWLATDMARIASVAQFGRWYGANLTLRVQVQGADGSEEIVRLADIGPIAFREVAVMVPVDRTLDSVRVRLEFTADQWRIDHVAFGTDARRVAARTVAPSAVIATDGSERDDVLRQITEADGSEIVTQPGDRFFVEFETGPSSSPRTFLLGAHGYYIEWIRGGWLQRSEGTGPFDPDAVRLRELLDEWTAKRDSMEQLFYSTRVPVV